MQREINIEIDKKSFIKMLGLKDPVIDYDKIVTKALQEIKIPKPQDGKPGKAGSDGADGSPDTGVEIIKKINDVSLKGPKIDARRLMNLTQSYPMGGFNPAVTGTGSNAEIPGGTVNGVNTSFTASHTPVYIVVDRVPKYRQFGDYSYSGGVLTILDGAPPVQNILSIY